WSGCRFGSGSARRVSNPMPKPITSAVKTAGTGLARMQLSVSRSKSCARSLASCVFIIGNWQSAGSRFLFLIEFFVELDRTEHEEQRPGKGKSQADQRGDDAANGQDCQQAPTQQGQAHRFGRVF